MCLRTPPRNQVRTLGKTSEVSRRKEDGRAKGDEVQEGKTKKKENRELPIYPPIEKNREDRLVLKKEKQRKPLFLSPLITHCDSRKEH